MTDDASGPWSADSANDAGKQPVDKIAAPWSYAPEWDCDGERAGVDHFVLNAKGDEISCAPNEETSRLIAAAPGLLAALEEVNAGLEGFLEAWGDRKGRLVACRNLIAEALRKATGQP